MSAWLFARPAAAVLALSWLLVPAAMAQQTGSGTSNQTEQGPAPGQTGVGPRGAAEVSPSTTPGQPKQPTAAQTGVGPRGTEVAPSTNPTQGGTEKH